MSLVITEAELREMWRNGRQALPAFPPGTRFSPAAQDFLKDHGLQIRFEAPTPEPPISGGPSPASSVQLLSARLDSLQAQTGLAAAEARRYRLSQLAAALEGLAIYCGEIRSAEAAGRPAAPLALLGQSEASLGAMVGAPERLLGRPHAPPRPDDHPIRHWLNVLRAAAREAAVAAQGGSLSNALDVLSHAFAFLDLLFISGQLAWQPGPDG